MARSIFCQFRQLYRRIHCHFISRPSWPKDTAHYVRRDTNNRSCRGIGGQYDVRGW